MERVPTQNLSSKIQNGISWLPNPKSKIQNPKSQMVYSSSQIDVGRSAAKQRGYGSCRSKAEIVSGMLLSSLSFVDYAYLRNAISWLPSPKSKIPNRKWYRRSLLPTLTGSILLCFLGATGARGQIIPDTTLPNNSIVTPSPALEGAAGGNAVTITGGTIAESYLFHSFSEFSIPTGGAALFDNPVAIENIISRVTGSSISEIDGLIRASGGANLFLLNPNGIIIGPNAALAIGGSFVGTTADSLKFADGGEFSARDPEAPPLLTINVPLGLQVGSSTPPGPILVRGFGNNLISNPGNAPTIRDFRPLGFEVNPGQTLALVGGDVTLEGGNITAVGGRIELWSVANGELSVVSEVSPAGGSRLKIESPFQSQAVESQAALEFGDINLLQAASADVSGNGGGEIQVRGRRVELRDGSAILADTLGTEPGGSLTISASESVQIIGTSAFPSGLLADVVPEEASGIVFPSSLVANVGTEATGTGGNVTIESDRLLLADGGQIAASTFGFGNAGSLTARASSVELRGTSAEGLPSGLFTASAAIGAGGNLTVEAGSLRVADGAQVVAAALGFGDAGDVNISAGSVEITGSSAVGFPSSLTASSRAIGAGGNLTIEGDRLLVGDGAQVTAGTVGSGDAGSLTIRNASVEIIGTSAEGIPSSLSTSSEAMGAGGNLTVESDRLLVADGAQVLATAFDSGNAGSLTIKATEVEILGTSVEGLPTNLSTSSEATGAGGNLTVEASRFLRVADGAQVAASTLGSGNAGNLTVVTGEAELAGTSPNGLFSSGLFASAVVGPGSGGDVAISANKLIVRDGAIVSASNFSSLDPSIPPGTGAAGNINIEANSILLNNLGILSADTGGGDRGNIMLQSRDVRLRRDSNIRTNAQGEATGGNITMDVDNLVALLNSDITANAQQSFGGRVIINARGIFGSEFRPALTPENDITTSSELGAEFSGIVELNTPDTDPSSGLLELPGTPIDIEGLLARDLCTPERLAGSSFVIAGRGGLPPNPVDPLTNEKVLLDWSRPSATSGMGSNSAGDIATVERLESGGFSVKSDRSSSNLPLQIREAQGWIVAPDGTVILTADAIGVTPASPILLRAGCDKN